MVEVVIEGILGNASTVEKLVMLQDFVNRQVTEDLEMIAEKIDTLELIADMNPADLMKEEWHQVITREDQWFVTIAKALATKPTNALNQRLKEIGQEVDPQSQGTTIALATTKETTCHLVDTSGILEENLIDHSILKEEIRDLVKISDKAALKKDPQNQCKNRRDLHLRVVGVVHQVRYWTGLIPKIRLTKMT